MTRVFSVLRRRIDERADAGFTLIEMMVALAIIATALFALLGGLVTASASIQAQQEDARAVRVALDRYETLRLRDWTNDPDLQPGVHTGQAVGSNGLLYTYATTVVERDTNTAAPEDDDIDGDLVKDLTTVVTWEGRNGRTRQITYKTSLAQDPSTVGLRSAYIQVIKSMNVAPQPSVVVNFDGYTDEPIYVTVEMSGFAAGEVLPITWTDANGLRTGQALSDDGRFWRLTIPAGTGGIRVADPQTGVSSSLTFRVVNRIGQTAQSTLTVFGPPNNPPNIGSFAVNPNPISTFNGGLNRQQNRTDVTFTCDVTGLNPGPNSLDSVKVRYQGETAQVEQTLAWAGGTTYSHTFPRSTVYFAEGTNHPYTCVVRRANDGGPASSVQLVTVGRA